MSYKVSEINSKLNELICGLLVDPRVTESPVFNYSLLYASNMMDDFHQDDKPSIDVSEENNKVMITSKDSKTSIVIASSNPNQFSITEDYTDNQDIRTALKRTTKYSSNTGEATIETQYASISKSDSGVIISPVYVKESFDSDGIEVKREHIEGNPVSIAEGMSIRSILLVPESLSVPNKEFKHKTVYTRTGFNTATFYDEDKELGTVYNSTIPLDDRAPGLIATQPSEEFYPERVEMFPMSREEIDRIISRVGNSKLRDGLQRLSVGRESYSYDSLNDPNFVRKGFSNSIKK